jgi:hypothetical protein
MGILGWYVRAFLCSSGTVPSVIANYGEKPIIVDKLPQTGKPWIPKVGSDTALPGIRIREKARWASKDRDHADAVTLRRRLGADISKGPHAGDNVSSSTSR